MSESLGFDLAVDRDVDLSSRTSFGISAEAAEWIDAPSVYAACEAIRYARASGKPFYVLGEGANVLFTERYEGVIVHPTMGGLEMEELSGCVEVHAGAGAHFDDLVRMSVSRGLWGLECLGGIPGAVGAAPVQNIGAYGAELSQVLHSVRVLDMDSLQERTYGATELELGYRDSIFKRGRRGRDLILGLSLRLGYAHPSSQDFSRLGLETGGEAVSPQRVYDHVVRVRDGKLPRVGEVGSAGSFFKNPVVDMGVRDALMGAYPDMPFYPADGARVKLSAGWLIDMCGWKGYRAGDAGVWPKQALVLVNYGRASGVDMVSLFRAIQEDVHRRMGVLLEPEVNVVGSLRF